MSDATLNFKVTNDPMFAENGYTVYLREGGPCWVIDPGLPPQAEDIVKFIRDHDLKPEAVIITHAHGDHIAGVDDVRSAFDTPPLYLAEPEWHMLGNPNENLSVNIGIELTVSDEKLHDLAPGLTLELDGTQWTVLDTSGHSPGGRSLYCAQHEVVIVGDALFAGGIGRYDFHHSNGEQLLSNIRQNLYSLPDETRVLSGHGPDTTIGREKATNPFVR